MRIGYVVGSLARGGAELQLLQLASSLIARGHSVNVFSYGGPSLLDHDFVSIGARVDTVRGTGRGQKVGAVRCWMRKTGFDVVHAIQRRASTVSLLARMPARRPAVLASDYSSATYGQRSIGLMGSLITFALADRVVTEVDLNRASIVRLAPWLRGKTQVIRNGVDTDRFSPAESISDRFASRFVFCVVGTVSAVKNPWRVIDAVAELRRRGHENFHVDWYGRDGVRQGMNVGQQARDHAAKCGVQDHIVFHGDVPQVEQFLRQADALLHASVHEGFPNAVAEGMACGLPIGVSRVSDLPRVVGEAQNGVVFDETDANSIADAMSWLMTLPDHERAAMGARSRELAVRWFHQERFVDEFEALYRTLQGDGS